MTMFVERVVEAGFGSRRQFRGCSAKEISALESSLGVTLPAVYREFLREMGHASGSLYTGSDVSYDDLFDLRDQLEEVLREDGSPSILRPDIFVFSGHQGCIFHFFYTSECENDPAVYGYLEGDTAAKKIADTFSEFFIEGIKELKEIREQNNVLRRFNDNRKTNPQIAYEAGIEFLRKYPDFGAAADSIRQWIDEYDRG